MQISNVCLIFLTPGTALALSTADAAAAKWIKYQQSLAQSVRPRPPPDTLGEPAHFHDLKAGPFELSVTRSDSLDGSDIAFGVQRLAARPSCFHLRGILSSAECDHIVAEADKLEMKEAITAGGTTRSGCSVAWLKVAADPVCSELTNVIAELILGDGVRDPKGWGRDGGFENLQVLKYSEGGEFKLHHDANEETPRILVCRARRWNEAACPNCHQH